MELTKSRRRVVVAALCGLAALACLDWYVASPVCRPLKDLRVDEVASVRLTDNHGLADVTLGNEDREYVAGLISDLAGTRLGGRLQDMSGTEPVFIVETTTRGTIEVFVVAGFSYFTVGGTPYHEAFGTSVVQRLEEVYQRYCNW